MKVHGVDLIADGDMVLHHQHRTGKPFEAESIAEWRDIAAGTMVDVGAYTGLYSILAAQHGADRVVAFEPNIKVFDRLLENAAINGVSSLVDFYLAGVSDSEGEGDLQLNTNVRLTSAGRVVEGKGIKLITLDSLLLRNVTAIKIDTEGMESSVLRGGINTIKRDMPLLITEALCESALVEQQEILFPIGYRCRQVDQWNVVWRA